MNLNDQVYRDTCPDSGVLDDGDRLQGREADGHPEEDDTVADEAGVQDLFKCRLYNLCIINAGLVMKIVYGIAKQVFDPMTILKF